MAEIVSHFLHPLVFPNLIHQNVLEAEPVFFLLPFSIFAGNFPNLD